jgi:hypothetical protein
MMKSEECVNYDEPTGILVTDEKIDAWLNDMLPALEIAARENTSIHHCS